MSGYFETGFPIAKALTDEFSRQFPNVTWDVREDQFAVITQNAPRVLADDPPDLMRLPQVSELVKDDLLKNLDGYAGVFGWDEWPASQLEQLRMKPGGGPRGEGSLFAMGLNFSVTGVFYNKAIAERIGMTAPPATLAELDDLLAKARQANVTTIVQFNGGATGGFAFPLQNLMASYGEPGPVNDWIFQKPGATIDTASNRQAAQHLQDWIRAGYFDRDANAMDYATMMSKFTAGDGLLMFNGDWESGNLDEQMSGNVGFFPFPSESGDTVAAMSAPLTVGIAANAANADCAAFFLDWVATNAPARALTVEVGGSHPMGPPDGPMPPVEQGTVTAETLAAGATISADDGAMDFIANATGSRRCTRPRGWTAPGRCGSSSRSPCRACGRRSVCVTVTVIAALASFDIIYVATQGGPGNTTMVPGLEIYYQAFVEREIGVASALAVVLVVLVLVCVLPVQRLTRDSS